jgi:ACS family sodium-dependent inorganic phosphate cotransporter
MKNVENGDVMSAEPLTDNISSPMWMFWKRRRYMVVVMSFFGFFNLYSLRVNLSIAIVAMTQHRNRTIDNGNGTYEEFGPDFDWDMNVRGLVLSAYFYGYIVTQLLGGYSK